MQSHCYFLHLSDFHQVNWLLGLEHLYLKEPHDIILVSNYIAKTHNVHAKDLAQVKSIG